MVTIADYSGCETAWCPGCGNFGILNSLKKALVELSKEPHEVLFVSGIGQAAKMPHYLKGNVFNGLHGRTLPAAFGAKCAYPKLEVIVTTGDGDCYGEGGNHLIHAIRRNMDMTVLVHNNEVYGLTKGQASPTALMGVKTKVQHEGVISQPLNPLALAISLGCGFVARSFSGNTQLTVDLIKQAVSYRGFALVDILQPCVTFNKEHSYQWYQSHTAVLANHDSGDRIEAFKKSLEDNPIPLGILYRHEYATYTDHSPVVQDQGLCDSAPSVTELYALMTKEFF